MLCITMSLITQAYDQVYFSISDKYLHTILKHEWTNCMVAIFAIKGSSLPDNQDMVEECYRAILSMLDLPLITRDDRKDRPAMAITLPPPAVGSLLTATVSHQTFHSFQSMDITSNSPARSIELWTYVRGR